MRITVSSPYAEVCMDTSGTYALIKARTDTSKIYAPSQHTGHTHTLHVTYTIDKHILRARSTRKIYTIRTQFTSTLYACTIYMPNLWIKSTRPTYAYNLHARLTRYVTSYVLVWRVRILRFSSARMCYTLVLPLQSTRPTYAIRHVIRLILARTYYTSYFGTHVFIIESVPNSKLSSNFPENKNTRLL